MFAHSYYVLFLAQTDSLVISAIRFYKLIMLQYTAAF